MVFADFLCTISSNSSLIKLRLEPIYLALVRYELAGVVAVVAAAEVTPGRDLVEHIGERTVSCLMED